MWPARSGAAKAPADTPGDPATAKRHRPSPATIPLRNCMYSSPLRRPRGCRQSCGRTSTVAASPKTLQRAEPRNSQPFPRFLPPTSQAVPPSSRHALGRFSHPSGERLRALVLSNLLKRRVLLILVLVFAILGGSVVYAQAGKATTTYRTAAVTYGTITQTIGMAGNLAPVSEADLNFASTGTVETVTAQVGETVVAGQILAALDPTILEAQLSQAQATLASARSKLAQDQAGPNSQTLASAQNPVAAAQVSVNNATTSLADAKAINAQSVTAAQNTVTGAQSTVTADQGVVNQDNTTLTADELAPAADCPSLPACAVDTAAVNSAQAKLATDQQTLAHDQTALDAAKTSLGATTVNAEQ